MTSPCHTQSTSCPSSQAWLSSPLKWELAERESGLLTFQPLRRVEVGPGLPELWGRGSPYSSFQGTVLLLIVQLIRMCLTVRASCQAEQHPDLWRPGKRDVLKPLGPSPVSQPHMETLLKFYQLHICQMLTFWSPGMCVVITIIKAFRPLLKSFPHSYFQDKNNIITENLENKYKNAPLTQAC